MKILGIETSCDETSAAIIKATNTNIKLLSNVVASSLDLHSKTGGIIPEVAARQQVKYIIPVIEQALKDAFSKSPSDTFGTLDTFDTSLIDAIAVTYGPGLIGSLLVGVETAKTLAYTWNKPLIPVNHLYGHIYANWIGMQNIDFPAIALIVSGGHTDLVLMRSHKSITWLGGTRDDAAGEAFDKIGRLLGLSYPGGPAIEKASEHGNVNRFKFPRPIIDSNDFDFSFSGLKTAVLREVQRYKGSKIQRKDANDIAAGVQKAIIDVLVAKTLKAAKKYNAKSILLGGGVAANSKLRKTFESSISNYQSVIKLFVPQKSLCTDNAAMIATAAFFHNKSENWQTVTANPELYFD